jgi:hypothetical protein
VPEISTYALSDGTPGGIHAPGSSKLAEERCGFSSALASFSQIVEKRLALGLAVGGEVGRCVGAGVTLGAAVVCTKVSRVCFGHVAGMDSV